jgi:hypothetical protein
VCSWTRMRWRSRRLRRDRWTGAWLGRLCGFLLTDLCGASFVFLAVMGKKKFFLSSLHGVHIQTRGCRCAGMQIPRYHWFRPTYSPLPFSCQSDRDAARYRVSTAKNAMAVPSSPLQGTPTPRSTPRPNTNFSAPTPEITKVPAAKRSPSPSCRHPCRPMRQPAASPSRAGRWGPPRAPRGPRTIRSPSRR